MTISLPFERAEIEGSIIARWRRVVHHFPQQIAVTTVSGEQYSYGELDQASNRLAHALLAELGTVNCPIILLFEHSYALLVSILGTLKANKAYVAFDPTLSVGQLQLLSETTAAPLIVTDFKHHALAQAIAKPNDETPEEEASLSKPEIWCSAKVHFGDESLPATDRSCPDITISPDSIAGIFFTSGTIKRAKGIPRSHRIILHRIWFGTSINHFAPGDCISGIRQCGLGGGVADLFNALLNGATYCIYNLRRHGLHGLSNWLQNQKITYFHPPIVLFRQWLETLSPDAFFPHLRQILPSGRKTHDDLVRLWPYVSDNCVVLTSYATTETTLITCSKIDRWTPTADGVLHVGCPLPDKSVMVVREDGKMAEIGEVGEVVVRSRYIASGYWRQPELTLSRFSVADDGSGEITYRTGDIGRWRADGFLELLGRRDSQIKLRGYRVVLGELEDALRALPSIKEAVVTANEERGLLYAYAIAATDPPEPARTIRATLAKRLPDYLLPTHLIYLPHFPLLASGKVNRQALPEPASSRPELDTPYAPPQDAYDAQLVAIWEKLLGIKGIGIHDDFFELGGHSLLAMQLISRAREALRVEIPLRTFFDAPTVAQLAEAIVQHQALSLANPQSIPRRDSTAACACSFSQLRFWFLHQLEPEAHIYNMPKLFEIKDEAFKVEALQQALNAVVARHEVLRTTFSLQDGQLVQIISDHGKLELPIIDLRLTDDRQQVLQKRLEEEIRCPFDLSSDLMLRSTLFRLGETEYVLLLVTHHIASDNWSSRILLRELTHFYHAFSTLKPSSLPELPIQYADFALWQQQKWQEKGFGEELSYWKEQLAGIQPVYLPTDHARSARQSYRGVRHSLRIEKRLSEALNALSHQEGVTLFMTLLSAFKVLLMRYTGEADICVGIPIAGRQPVETENLLGCFINTLLLRTQVEGELTFSSLLQRVRSVALDAYAHQELPFEKLVEELQPERDLSHPPLFQVLFNFTNTPQTAVKDSSKRTASPLRPLKVDRQRALFDLTLAVRHEAEGLTVEFEYNTDLFNTDTITRMKGHWKTLLEGIVANPAQPISQLPLLTEAEREQLLVEWSSTPTIRPKHLCIHELFESQVRRTPDAMALICQGESLTYRALNARANQLAHHLQGHGVGPEVLVGICMTRSLDLVVGILGILKAGGAYVPLDPMYPKERMEFILQDTQSNIFLTQQSLLSRLSSLQTEVLCMDTEWADIAQLPSTNPILNAQAENLAYVIYTSGSTGKPKGVMITHKSLSFFMKTVQLTLGISASDVYLQTGSITYALSVRQLMITLCHGATLVVATELEVKDPLSLFRLIKEQGVTRMDFVPSHWRSCNQALATLDPTLRAELLDNELHHIVSIGEPLLSDIPSQWRFDFNHPAQLVNIFGQTETTGVVMAYPIPVKHQERVKVVPIGRPAANTQIYILDANLQPVPVGVTGILYISSPTLARGYLNRPELTAKTFISNPFSNAAGARLYKTGDLARYSPDGNIEFLGRKDHQVKLRGIRIELGEIESALLQHHAVQEAVVIAREETPENKRLVAYLVANQSPPQSEELRAFLKKKVPDYMVPSAFLFLEAMPLASSGKVNRRVLSDPRQFEKKSTDESTSQKEIADCFYVPSWKRTPPLQPTVSDQSAVCEATWLLFVDQCGLGNQIAHRLRELGASVLTVGVGQQFRRLCEGSIEINPTQPHDYDLLLKELNHLGQRPLKIAHLWSVTHARPSRANGFYSLLYLAQAVAALTMPIQIAVVSNQMQEVTGEEELCAEKATLLGPCKVIPLEYPNITCRSIDITLPSLIHQGGLQKLVEPLITELVSDLPEKIVAYRGRYRWVEYLERVRLDSPLKQPIRLREEGVYLITGGLGGIGIELASYLAQKVRAKLVLVSRSVPDDQEAHKIEKVRQLRQMGADLLLLRADVTNHVQMQHLITKTLEHFGALHGVIHAAGVRGVFETISQKTAQRAASVLAAKVHGTRVLEDVLKGIRLDFVLLCSSLASIVGRFGQVDYCAANAFLDAFAAEHTKRGTLTISVNWDIWQELKMPVKSVKSSESFAIRQLLEVDMQKGLLSQEGVEAFSRILASNWHQVIVSKRDILGRMGLIDEKGQSHIQLTSVKGKSRTPTEDSLAAIWSEVLKTESISIHDNFFELGGHSLKATQVVSRIRDTFQIELPLRRLFETPTIAGLAEYISASRNQPSPMRAKSDREGESRFSSLVPIQPHGSKQPFFLVPGGGGSESEFLIYAPLIHLLGAEQPVYGFYARGLLDDQPPHTDVSTMAADYLQEMRLVQPQGPYLLGGECIGGKVAYEMARQLQEQGEQVAGLLLMDTSLPQMSANRIGHLHRQFARQQRRVQHHLEQLQPLSFAKRLRYIGQKLHNWQMRRLPLTPEQLKMQQKRRIRSNYSHLLRRYRPQELYSGSIILLVSEDHYQKGRIMGWHDLASDGLEVYPLPGDHDSYIGEHVETTAAQLRACLEAAQG